MSQPGGTRQRRAGRRAVLGHLLQAGGLLAVTALGGAYLLSARSRPGQDFRRGLELHREGRYAEAVEQFTRVLEAQPDNPLPHVMQGVAYFNDGRFEEAVASFTQALPLTGGDPVVHLYRGEALLALGRPAEAREDFAAALYSPRGNGRVATAARVKLKALEASATP